MFKVGDKVICVNNDEAEEDLVLEDEIYEVIGVDDTIGEYVDILLPNGKEIYGYFADRFELAKPMSNHDRIVLREAGHVAGK
jgi:hypothetical protein